MTMTAQFPINGFVSPRFTSRPLGMLMSNPTMLKHRVVKSFFTRIGEGLGESLHEDTVDAVLSHPLKVQPDGCPAIRTENLNRVAVSVLDSKRKPVLWIDFGDIGQHVYC